MRDLTKMTIVEGIKELKIIKKKMRKNADLITKYSSQPDSEKALLGDRPAQEAEVKSLVQSTEDLAKEYNAISVALTYTNLIIAVEINGKVHTIHELIQMRRELLELRLKNYQAMNDNNYNSAGRRFGTTSADKVQIERYYDEKWKQGKIRETEDLLHAIDSRLENINATTNLSLLS